MSRVKIDPEIAKAISGVESRRGSCGRAGRQGSSNVAPPCPRRQAHTTRPVSPAAMVVFANPGRD